MKRMAPAGDEKIGEKRHYVDIPIASVCDLQAFHQQRCSGQQGRCR